MESLAETNRNQTGQVISGQAIDFMGFATLFRGVALFRQSMVERRAERRVREQMARELASYTDRELSELGFSRADLPMIAAGTYRR